MKRANLQHSCRTDRLDRFCRRARPAVAAAPGFSLIELLIVLAIIAVLISVLLPTLSRARDAARRTADLSNLRQLTAASLIYAQEHRGWLPPGRVSYEPVNEDDYTWLSYSNCWSPLVALAPALQKLNSCVSVRDAMSDTPFGQPSPDYGLANYPTDTRVGWIYWGGRDDLFVNGQLAYRSVHRLGQHLTPGSQTLWTCYCWDSAGFGGASVCPHVGTRCVLYPNGVALKPPPDGLGVALNDGSASFVKWNDMIIIPQSNGWKLYYQP